MDDSAQYVGTSQKWTVAILHILSGMALKIRVKGSLPHGQSFTWSTSFTLCEGKVAQGKTVESRGHGHVVGLFGEELK